MSMVHFVYGGGGGGGGLNIIKKKNPNTKVLSIGGGGFGPQPINKQDLKYILPLQDTDIINNNRDY